MKCLQIAMILSIVYFLDCFSQSTLNEREAPYFHDFNWKRPDHALFLHKQVLYRNAAKFGLKLITASYSN